jgi:endonuclease/exonuclease/phosphatase family metal-dependent hydrolase
MAMRSRAAVCIVAVALAATCRHSQPYLDPLGPSYLGALAHERARGPGLRIVTFNIEYALRVERALVALREHSQLRDADLLLLQEMDGAGTQAIARALGLNYVYYPASVHPKHRRDVGNAILTPWPIERTFKLPLPHASRLLRQTRAATGAIVRVGDLRVRVYSVHLGSPFGASPRQRRDQLEVVLCDARDHGGPVVIAGDFNSGAIGERLVADGYVWLTQDVGATRWIFSLDHVFAKGLAFARAAAGVARDVRDASDHRPVWAELLVDSGPAR